MRWALAPALVLGVAGLVRSDVLTIKQAEILFAALVAVSLAAAMPRFGMGQVPARALAVGFWLAVTGLLGLVEGVRLFPHLAVAAIYGLVALAFLRGLGPGRETPIAQMVRITGLGPEGSDGFRRFALLQCRIWAAIAIVMATLACLAMVSPVARGWIAPGLPVLAAAQIAWFVLTHRHAQRRHGRPESALDTARAMTRPGAWAALRL